jgi:hypothetical protein
MSVADTVAASGVRVTLPFPRDPKYGSGERAAALRLLATGRLSDTNRGPAIAGVEDAFAALTGRACTDGLEVRAQYRTPRVAAAHPVHPQGDPMRSDMSRNPKPCIATVCRRSLEEEGVPFGA